MSKRPAFQFYPSDWRKDAGLRLCSAGARALWIDMLCLMHEGEPYGHLTVFGRAMAPESLAKLVGESAASVRRWLAELAENEVYSTNDDGQIFSRRMVRDETIREARAAGGFAGAEHGAKGGSHGRKGGRPKGAKGGSENDGTGDKKPPLKPPPSSSSSSSSAASQGSEDKSSGASGAEVDLDALTWRSAVAVLTDQGGMAEAAARKFFGKLLSSNGLGAKDLLPALSGALVKQTRDPQSYLTRAAEGVAKRTAAAAEPKRVAWI